MASIAVNSTGGLTVNLDALVDAQKVASPNEEKQAADDDRQVCNDSTAIQRLQVHTR